MAGHRLSILLVDDDEDEYVLVRSLLSEIEDWKFDLEWAATYEAALKAIQRSQHDVCLVDYRLGAHNGLELLRWAGENGSRAPMIFLTGQGAREIDMEAMKAGAADYLIKGQLDSSLLERSIRYAVERRRAEETLKESEQKYRTLLETAQEGVYMIDAEFRITYVNRRMADMLGYTAQEVLGRRSIDFMDEEGRAQARRNLERRKSGVAEIHEFRFVRKDGSALWVLISTTPLMDASGQFTGAFGMVTDITGRKRVEEELRERTEQLEALNKELEAFSYSVSHDLRAPLRHIDGFVGLLQESASSLLDEKSRRYLKTISEAAMQMGNLIDDLLAFSRMGRVEMRSVAVQLEQLVQEVVQDAQKEAQERSVVWKIGGLPEVQGDPSMLRQALVNLISNAVKYTRTRAEAQVEIGSADGEDKEIVVFIRDNGVGFDMQYVGKLFGVFQRLHRADEFEGTGIGLANVRRIIHRHGGRTWAEGCVDGGATFYFSLPAARKEGGP